ncbi:MAG TPA: ankyrin repeat domain-containing protein, partial [Gemmataceae bacterium]|nr:ankyrin repeat domain-containing protein [Gemmataceae bacterium]
MRCFRVLPCLVVGFLASVAVASDPKLEARDALWAAVRAGDEKAVVAALDKGADVNAKNEYGVSAIWIASNKGKKEIVELLLKRGADPNSRDDIWYQTPLSQSIARPDNIKAILKAGAKDIDANLVTAASRGLSTAVGLLLESGKASQEALDAALLATSETNKELRETLTKAGAKPLPVLGEKERDALKPFVGSFESEYGGVMKLELKDFGLTNST